MQRMLRHVCGGFELAPKSNAQRHRTCGEIAGTRAARHGTESSDAGANENLQKAVADENYETAASLRDQIKQLESELSNSP